MIALYNIFKLLFFKLFISIFSHEIIYYKNQLRYMYKEQSILYINMFINDEYNNIVNNVIFNAKKGITELNFTIFCNQHNIYSSNILQSTSDFRTMTHYISNFISEKEIINKVLNKIKRTFIDCNITFSKKRFTENNDMICNYYTISW